MPQAARLGDPIGHTSAMAGLVAGALAGLVVAASVVAIVGTGGVAAVAIGAGILAAGAGGGLAGEYIGEAIMTPTGLIISGSGNTMEGGPPGSRAKLDQAKCAKHGPVPVPIAEGSSTVYINGQPAARKGDKLMCGAVIMKGCPTVIIGGATKQVLPVASEVPAWLHNTLVGVMWGGAIIATGGAAAVYGVGPAVGAFVGSIAGGAAFGWLGGKIGEPIGRYFGNAELGKRIGEVGGGVLGSVVGGGLGARAGKLAGRSKLGQSGGAGSGISADKAYDAIRAKTTDVDAIAKNTGFKPSNIQQVKDHLFYKEHLLDRYEKLGVPSETKRFDSNADIAAAWERLEKGTHTPEDIRLLKHEAAEAWYMEKYGPSYNNAHEAAQSRYPSPLN